MNSSLPRSAIPDSKWRFMPVRTEDEAQGFLGRVLTSLPLSSVGFEQDSRPHEYYLIATSECKRVLGFETEDDGRSLTVKNFFVEDDYRERKLGPINAKAVLGIAFARGLDTIRLVDVEYDGPNFWAPYAAKPRWIPDDISENILKAMRECTGMTNNDRRALTDIADIGVRNSRLAWNRLAVCGIKTENGRYFRGIVFEKMILDRDDHSLYIDLTCPVTRGVLRQNFGNVSFHCVPA